MRTITRTALSVAAAAAALWPALGSAQEIDSGATAWLLTSTALVLLMTLPGLALFYGGLVRSRNVLSVLMQCFALCCVVSILWFAFGYSAAFTGGDAASLGGFEKPGHSGGASEAVTPVG